MRKIIVLEHISLVVGFEGESRIPSGRKIPLPRDRKRDVSDQKPMT